MPFFDDPFLEDENQPHDVSPAEAEDTPDEDLEEVVGGADDETVSEEELTQAAEEKEKRHLSVLRSIFDYVEIVCITFCIVMLATMFVFRHAIVDGDSMNNTLADGEHLIISDLFYTPARGDIVIFEDNLNPGGEPLVKRIIAVEGEVVVLRESGIYVNGELLEESYASLAPNPNMPTIDDYLSFMSQFGVAKKLTDDTGEVYYQWNVPEGHIFVMGDNRFNSRDSRYFGTVDTDTILGRVLFRLFPLEKAGAV